MVKFWILVAVLVASCAALIVASGQFHPDCAGHPYAGLAMAFGLFVLAPAILLGNPWTFFLFPFVVGAIVVLGWKRFVRQDELAGKVLFLVWTWSGFIGIGTLVVLNTYV